MSVCLKAQSGKPRPDSSGPQSLRLSLIFPPTAVWEGDVYHNKSTRAFIYAS